jgi:hypothetical protein
VLLPRNENEILLTPPLTRAPWQVLLDPTRRFDEIDGVISVLVQTRRDCQDIWIENDIVRWKPGPLGQQIVSARADFGSALESVSLAFLIECHHDGGGAVSPDQLRLAQKFFFAVFQADSSSRPLCPGHI